MTLSPRLVMALLNLSRTLALLALLCAAMLPTTHAWAQEGVATVRLDGRTLFRIGPSEALEPRPRARQIERQLAAVLETPQGITPARIEPTESEEDDGLQISVAGRPLIVVTPADAEANGQPLDRLARNWAAIIDRALATAAKRRDSDRGRFLTSVQSSVETAFARLLESAISIIPRVLAALLVLLLFWGLATAVRALMKKVVRRLANDLTVENLVRQVSYYAVWVLGIIVAASAFGLEPSTLATGLGLTSLALGFALKDILSNFVSGLLILTLRPFQLGDQIIIGETEGSVERIELRATQIRTYDGRRVLVPNAETFTSRVTNNTAAPIRRGKVVCMLGYGVDIDAISAVMREAAQQTTGVLATPEASAHLIDLGESQLVFDVQFWCDSRRSDFVATASEVRKSLIAALRAARVTLPDEARQNVVLHTPKA
ncbi:mechanosensitive ion channel family protein [Stutzerimonas xanthomarina]|uniref:Small-conductance mechanosensitive channel n=2 Tax=Stutzerimonas xanthomarina TaxID=271420 RepID=A0A1M5S8Y5_9GAMM|nr:mechanosensitive ion channel family protein [Stutzerimonas xanthomarina]MCP9340067.1 mechanosensitive ion channel family protein [Stutzerimonas xanthomarina]SEH99036.1 Mechanosensitive ion channel [Stutzerimonas xanthomarina]SHH34949.1 Mechanosensitive ion channel [Stutzerimonas xanthomarina DSM 18231]